jgi:hypothetical protein
MTSEKNSQPKKFTTDVRITCNDTRVNKKTYSDKAISDLSCSPFIVLPPFRNIRCVSFVKLIYLDIF